MCRESQRDHLFDRNCSVSTDVHKPRPSIPPVYQLHARGDGFPARKAGSICALITAECRKSKHREVAKAKVTHFHAQNRYKIFSFSSFQKLERKAEKEQITHPTRNGPKDAVNAAPIYLTFLPIRELNEYKKGKKREKKSSRNGNDGKPPAPSINSALLTPKELKLGPR